MIRSLKFKINSNDGWDVNIEVSVKDKDVYYSVGGVTPSEKYEDSEGWLSRLAAIDLETWDDRYGETDLVGKPIAIGEDRVDWELTYKEGGREARKIQGRNTVPYNWDALMDLMEELAPGAELIDPKRLDYFKLDFTQDMEIPAALTNMMNGVKTGEDVSWKYEESITIWRKERKLVYEKNMAKGCTVTQTFNVDNAIAAVMDVCEDFMRDHGALDIVDDEDDYEEDAINGACLEVGIKLHNGEQVDTKMSYDRRGLPNDWINLMEKLGSFIMSYTQPGELFNAAQFQCGVRENEYIVLAVVFEGSNTPEPYLTDDDTLRPGDRVRTGSILLSTDGNNPKSVGIIDHIEYYSKDKMPYSVNRLPKIQGRA